MNTKSLKSIILALTIQAAMPCIGYSWYLCYPNIFANPPQCSCGYLARLGPAGWRHLPPPTTFDRNNLISITQIEKEIYEDIQSKHSVQSKVLEEAHQNDLKKLEVLEGEEDFIVASPVAIPAADVVIEVDADEATNSSFDPNDLLLYIEEEVKQGGANTTKAVFPFQLPFQEAPTPLPIPSQSIYERK